jgi:hypothetical protein
VSLWFFSAKLCGMEGIRAALTRFWYGLGRGVRIGLGIYGVISLLLLIAIGVRPGKRREIKHEVVPLVAAPVATAPAPVKKEIVIDSVDNATLADIFSDDNNTSITSKSKVTELEMMRVANDWLQPQVSQLNYQVKEKRRSIEKNKKYLAENEPLLVPAREENTKLEETYKRANAALDLPAMPNSSFNEEMEARFQDVRTRLITSRKRLSILEEAIANAHRRLDSDEPVLAQLEVEASQTRERLDRVHARDPKILPITYEYAISGLTALPLLRFLGRGNWNLRLVSDISAAYEIRFHRSLPVSALGQSTTHDRLGWDHSHAADVALNPSSEEGQWLISFLRLRDIPFMAFRRAIPGIATGPHVHIGEASQRLRR